MRAATEGTGTDLVRVLFVEDEATDMELAREQLRAHGIAHVPHRVQTEPELREALKEFKPSIILCDFAMPGFTGLAALELVRELAAETPFLFVSGTIGEERAIETLRRGAVDYVLKSNLARLGPAVERALAEAAARRVTKRQELQIARLTSVLRMLSGINSAVVRIRDRKELLAEACRLAVSVGGYAAVVVGLRNKAAVLEPVGWEGMDPQAARVLCERISKRAAQEVHAGRVRREAPEAIAFEGDGRALVALPLIVDKTVIGVLAVYTRTPGALSEEEMRMLREVAANLSFALQYLQRDSRVRLLSYFDVLTGLAKRSLFCQRVGKLLTTPDGAASCWAVAVIDIENLSAVNDSFGRHAGDLLLQLLGDRLKRRSRDTEWLAHLGGGTFALLEELKGTGESELERLNGILGDLFSQPFALEAQDVPVAGRSGVAVYPEDGREAEALLQKAEAALRTAKASGERRGHYCAERHSAGLARVALERRLRGALEREEFELHYQAKVDVRTRRIEGVEALIRWRDPESGLVSPGKFLPVLESSGLILEVGEWVIERAARDCQEWVREGLPGVRVAVNVSPLQLRHGSLVECVLKHVSGWASESVGLDVEITEGALTEESSGDLRKLERLRAAGVKIAIDDFGTGYSSLGRLEKLPVDTLKVDQTFVRGMRSGARAKKLVGTIISLARALGMTVVAEGVEHQAELEALWELGCDQSQGYLHSKPVTAREFAELLSKGQGKFILPKEPGSAAPPASARAKRG